MEWDRDAAVERINQVMQSGIVPHNTALGFRALDCGPGFAVVEVPYREDLVGDPARGVIHGGVITTLLDAISGIAVFLARMDSSRIATLDLRIDYMGPATPGRNVIGRADCYKLTRSVAFVRGVAYHDDPADPIASSAGTFMIFRGEHSPFKEELGG